MPLVVQYPIEKGGVFREMAYYTSAHPALLSPDLSRAGRAYIHRMMNLAVQRLREKGTFISPQIVDVAARLDRGPREAPPRQSMRSEYAGLESRVRT